MRILMLNAKLPPSKSGVAHQVAGLANALASRGHQVVVRSFSPRPPCASYRVDQISTPKLFHENKALRLASIPLTFAATRCKGYDLIHAHGDNPLLWRKNVPVVRTFYGAAREEARFAETMRRRTSQYLIAASELIGRRLATVTVGISENTSDSLGGVDYVIPCGVDRKLFHPGPKSDNPTILYVGTIFGRKRGRLVVDIYKQLIRPQFPGAELWLVTDFEIKDKGIRNLGLVSDKLLSALYRAAWILTLPSTYEGFGVPYIEAMASGTAIVATPNAGARELVNEATGGILVEEAGLGEALLTLLNHAGMRSILASRGLSASSAFDWTQIAKQYESVYEIAVSRSR